MKLSQFTIMSGAVLAGFVLGLILAPSLRKNGPPNSSPSQGKSAAADPRISAIMDAPAGSPSRTHVKDREPAKKADEPRISVPVKTVVELLKEGSLGKADFKDLEDAVGRALETLGATQTECDEIKNLIKQSKDEIYAMEKTQFQLGLVAPDHIEIHTSGIWDAIHTIVGHLRDGIRATLKPEASEILVSAIDWKRYYPMDEKSSITSLEINRNSFGGLTAWVRTSDSGGGGGLDKKFPDDGTPLPADQIFPDRWKPYLKGLTILPKDNRIESR